ncbi:hypothetical protein MKZ08_08200 [Viridibacillus sp. FSL R5-0477]|uniref:Uncharacterized protein n=1 Tax=Viridibacillus arenosi FSL R5-213 TaxID=1227360 RepID=W4EUM1_9BACL|nr:MULTISPECIES: hypothetical protein [Viridibacillus]ETT84223.1 hypothetical protein C176_12683 [Viridibacillus arenosi FSL R5-213]OMC79256.1 hypothetical protein BK130_18895 [Viridibacillus sp. FSL H8-0123]OMC86475.1 hypothetical protein BK128_10420 [Viridibacillus sp. FSL H7-0596]OMC89983.1 hypothetical protein BK137_14640 [Viridibacillus arenosi]
MKRAILACICTIFALFLIYNITQQLPILFQSTTEKKEYLFLLLRIIAILSLADTVIKLASPERESE